MSAALLPVWRDDWALFLDVDGTLLEIAAIPAAVCVPERAVRVLATLQQRLQGAVALVSGRRIAELDRLFAPLRLPIAGVHGAERRDAEGRLAQPQHDAALAPARRLLSRWRTTHADVLIEDKGVALALHYRAAPERESAVRRIAAEAVTSLGPGFHVQEGKKVLEIKADSAGKGFAIAAFMRELPFRERVPVFVGDDLTDEDGFEVVNRLGGHSIAVGIDRPTRARWRLRDERDVLDWLDRGAGGERA
ncbi:MAG TPA: trehalose-phosphatase [Gammaproteobacteria bacterium]|jgi:trehalose 6-phosphate phosphatase|nr:trehalose-phosphatase [Gammaproteobacteria bacterium]